MSLTNTLLNELIEKELANAENDGVKIKLKTATKKKVLYTIICAIAFVITTALGVWFLSLADIVIYFVLMLNTTDAKIVAQLAKKSPDKQISDIIKEDIK